MRPSPEIGLAVLAALAEPRPAFARLQHERGSLALELGAALRVRRDRHGCIAVQTRASLETPWRDAPHLENFEVLDAAGLIEHALTHAARAYLGHAIAWCGLDDAALAPEQKAYAERRLRSDLFPPAATHAAAHHVRALLLTEIIEPRARRAVFLVHGRQARFRDFNEARAAGLDALVCITGETPNLAPLLIALIRAHARKQVASLGTDAIGRVRTALLTDPQGLAPRDWKWLAHQPNGVVRRLCTPADAAQGAETPDLLALRLYAASGEKRLPRAILDLDHSGGPLSRALATLARAGVPPAQFDDLARLMRLLIREARERSRRGQPLRFLRDDAGYVIDWWLDESSRVSPMIGHNATYASLIRRQQRWHQLMILRSPEHMQAWDSALPAYETAGLRVVPLTDSLMLAREGMEMRHCVASYARDCARGDTRIFALEDVDSGERATLELRRRAWVWFAGQIKGPCNAEVSSRLRVAADRLASRYTSADRRP
ncbi:MAG TPA: PcfJ domain-containing protein [Burkholderiales bacterium]